MKRSRVMMMTAVLLIGMAVWLPGLRSRRVAAVGPALSGTYGFSIPVPYAGNNNGSGTLQGTVTLDAGGTATPNGIIVSVDPDPNATAPQVQPLNSNPGSYSVNADGTGSMTFTDATTGKVTSLSFVITDGGSQLMLVVTTGLGNAVGTGIARKQ